jgi:purine-binding chemotaxis protein CheW
MASTQVRIRLGQEEYALPVESVLEVGELGPVTPVPGAPQGVIGVRNLRGQVMPVVDLARLMGLQELAERPRIVVVEDQDRRAGLVVDDVLDVGLAPEVTGSSDSPYLVGTALREGTLVGLVDLPALLDSLSQAQPPSPSPLEA